MRKIKKEKQKFLIRRSIKINKHRIKRKRKRNIEKKSLCFINKKKKLILNKIPPENFSLLQNPEEVLKYFQECIKGYKNGCMIHYDLRNIKKLTFETIILMLSILQDTNLNNNLCSSGGLPKNKECKKLLIESGFLEALHNSSIKGVINNNNNGKMIHHLHKTQKGDTSIGGHVTYEVINHTFDGRLYQNIYPIFIECMTNTKNHASFGLDNRYDWWLSYYKENDTKITKICFIDLGAGVLSTLNKNWLLDWQKFGISNDHDKLCKILNREIKKPSRTKKKKRGKGLPSINDFAQLQEIKNFTMITNGVYGDLEKQDFKKLKNKLRGTLYYWEVHPTIINN